MKNLILSSKLVTTVVLLTAIVWTWPSLAYQAPFASTAPVIDGVNTDDAWQKASWQAIDNLILGDAPSPTDFSGQFKMVWTTTHLYIMAEIVDDVLIDSTADPLVRYWEDDTFEIFIDEDQSGGDHHKNHSAFAYHISLDNQAVDVGEHGHPILLTEHLQSKWQRSALEPNKVVWEVQLKIFDANYLNQPDSQTRVSLQAGKKMGFQIAYCDSDDPARGRDSFIASNDVQAINGNKNRAYLTADVFDQVVLVP